jgi:hypothetical protein
LQLIDDLRRAVPVQPVKLAVETHCRDDTNGVDIPLRKPPAGGFDTFEEVAERSSDGNEPDSRAWSNLLQYSSLCTIEAEIPYP